MYEVVYFTDFSLLSLTVYKQQLQIVHESFHTDRPPLVLLLGSFGPTWHLVGTSNILLLTCYSMDTPLQTPLPRRLAPYLLTLSYFFTILTMGRTESDVCRLKVGLDGAQRGGPRPSPWTPPVLERP